LPGVAAARDGASLRPRRAPTPDAGVIAGTEAALGIRAQGRNGLLAVSGERGKKKPARSIGQVERGLEHAHKEIAEPA